MTKGIRASSIALAALLALVPGMATTAMFDDGNDRAFVKDLARKKNPDELERAILKAGRKVGAINLCNRHLGAPAMPIRHASCESGLAIVTVAHLLITKDNGENKLRCASWGEMMKGSRYLPNSSFYDLKNPNKNKKFVFQEVGLIFPPLNWDDLKDDKFIVADDMAIFCLARDVSKDVMPDGSQRGYFELSRAEPGEGNLSMIGIAADMGKSLEQVYQKNCDGQRMNQKLYHGCDANAGASASAIGILEDGELKLRALHSSSHSVEGVVFNTLPKADIKNPAKLNQGVLVEYILDLEKRGILPKSPM